MRSNPENCRLCGEKLDYLPVSKNAVCIHCGKGERANIICSKGHYVCDECHGKGAFDFVMAFANRTKLTDPLEIAEKLFTVNQKIPMLGCENALIAVAAIMASLRNSGKLNVTEAMIREAMERTKRQSLGGYCGLTGVCGVSVAVGACFSVLLGAACPKNEETAKTMRVVSRIVAVIADETGPCCCKSFVRTAIAEASKAFTEVYGFALPVGEAIKGCTYSDRHPHGCRKTLCRYY